jgi:pterin-4a-carbinolamine dehydratase
MKLSQLHEDFIDAARRPMTFGRLPVIPSEGEVPVVAVNKWQKTKEFLKKQYVFRETFQRNAFVKGLLDHEEDVGHNASIVVEEGKVTLTLSTHDVGVTELDKEYAAHADELFKDVVYSSVHDR